MKWSWIVSHFSLCMTALAYRALYMISNAAESRIPKRIKALSLKMHRFLVFGCFNPWGTEKRLYVQGLRRVKGRKVGGRQQIWFNEEIWDRPWVIMTNQSQSWTFTNGLMNGDWELSRFSFRGGFSPIWRLRDLYNRDRGNRDQETASDSSAAIKTDRESSPSPPRALN